MKNIGIKLIYLAVIITPIFGLWEYLGYLGFIPYTREEVLTPWYIKGIKDILLMLIYLSWTSLIFFQKKFKILPIFFLFLIFLIFQIFLNLFIAENYFIVLAGIRSLSPLFLIFFSYAFFSNKEIETLIRLMVFISLLMVPLSIIQLLFGIPIYGTLFDKFASRVTATFVQPSSLGIFLDSTIFLVHLFSFKYRNFLTLVLVPIIILTGSGISILGLFLITTILIVIKITNPYLKLSFILLLLPNLPLFVYLGINYLPTVTNRPDIFLSPQERIEIVKNYLFSDCTLKDILLGKGFGYGTNTIFTVFPDLAYNYGFIPDSLYISIISQIGIIGLLLFLFVNGYVYLKSKHPIKYSILLFLFFGITTNILELFPVNWIYSIILGSSLKIPRMRN
ncbi:MAG: hypothetical protein ACPLW7_01035 [Minisyncoccia bacterium]